MSTPTLKPGSLGVLLFVFVTLPLTLAFDRVNNSLYYANLGCDCLFMLDIFKNGAAATQPGAYDGDFNGDY